MTVPTISAAVAAPGVDGVLTFGGTADPGATIEIGEQLGGGPTVIGWATADGNGAWQFAFPASALGYGTASLAVRALDPSATPGAWSAPIAFVNADPEIGLRHVGADLASRLAQDAAGGLDATADLQALADEVTQGDGAPAVLDLAAGTYIVSATILLHSGSYFDAPGVTLEASATWQRPIAGSDAGTLLGYSMLANADYASAAVLDHDIQVRDVCFDWNGYDNYAGAGVRFVSAANVLVQGASFIGGEDGTAFLHDDGAVVNASTATGSIAYGFDNWDGPRNTVIENSTVFASRYGGIALTARGTAATDDAAGANVSMIGNHVFGADQLGLDVNSLSDGSSLAHVFIGGNHVEGPGVGLSVMGVVAGALLAGNTLVGSTGSVALLAGNPSLADPGRRLHVSNLIVTDNEIDHATEWDGQGAAIVIAAQNAIVAGNTVQFGSAPYALWIAGDSILSTGNILDDWRQGAVLTTWSSNVTLQDAPGLPMTPPSAQIPFALAGATLTVSGSGVLDMRGGASFAGVRTVQLQDGVGETVYLQDGAGVHVTVAAGGITGTASGTVGFGEVGSAAGLTIFGAAAADSIDLGAGNAAVELGDAREIVHANGGDDSFYVSAATAGATIDGGSGASQIVVLGGGTVTLGAAITDIATVKIDGGETTRLTLNALAGVTAWADNHGDTILAGGPGQTLVAGLGTDTLIGSPGGGDVFAGHAEDLAGDTIIGFVAGDTIDVTSVGIAGARFTVHLDDVPGKTTVYVLDGHDGMGVYLQGTIDGTHLHLSADPVHGVYLTDSPGIYSVFKQPDLVHVLDAIGQGGTDALIGASSTVFLGGFLVAGGTLALTADLAPIALPQGARLLLDGAGRTLDGGMSHGLTLAAGDLTLDHIALTGPGLNVALTAGAGILRLDQAGGFGGGATIAGGTLDLAATGAAGSGGIAFAGQGAVLRVEAGVTVDNLIYGFAAGNSIRLSGVTAPSLNFAPDTHVLTIVGNGGSLTLRFDPAAVQAPFVATSDATGTTLAYAACYCAGTRIRTDAGEMAIEDLAIGDRVVTVDGASRPIRWIGRRDYSAESASTHPRVLPVRIAAGALADEIPARDLYVSPLHGIWLEPEAALVPAMRLLNGVSITRADRGGAVRYLHIELERHDLIFAEGAPAETFVDCDSRMIFDNAADFIARYPDHRDHGHPDPARQLGYSSEAQAGWRRVAARAGIVRAKSGPLLGHIETVTGGFATGWAMDANNEHSPVELELLIDGVVWSRFIADQHRDDLERAGLASGHHGFRVAIRDAAARVRIRRVGDAADLARWDASIGQRACA